MFKRHKHNWDLIDKEVVEGRAGNVKAWGDPEFSRQAFKIVSGRVILTFKCQCGAVKVVEK